MAAFRGNHPAKLDDKGRLKLPAAYKQLLDSEGVKSFFITSDDGVTAQIWPLAEWEKREQQLASVTGLSDMDEAVNEYMLTTNYYGLEAEVDQQGRLLFPQKLRQHAGLDKDTEVDVMGMGRFLRVHKSQTLDQKVAENKMFTPEHRKKLSELFQSKPV